MFKDQFSQWVEGVLTLNTLEEILELHGITEEDVLRLLVEEGYIRMDEEEEESD